MDSILEQVRGKIFSFCDMPTKKVLRSVCHACALDVDVFTGLSVNIDDRSIESIQFAQAVRINKMYVRNIRLFAKDCAGSSNKESSYHNWMYDAREFKTVTHITLLGFINWKWIEESLVNFANLTSLTISGGALNSIIFPYDRKEPLIFPKLRVLEIHSMWAQSNILHPHRRRQIFTDSTSSSSSTTEEYSSDNDSNNNNSMDQDYENRYRNLPWVTDLSNNNSNSKSNSIPDESNFQSRSRSNQYTDHEKAMPMIISSSNKSKCKRSIQLKNTREYSSSTPVSDNVYQLLLILTSPVLLQFRLNYDEQLYNISNHLNWRDRPLRSFLQRHSSTLQNLILDGDQNDMECTPITRSLLRQLVIPDNLKFLFLSVVDHHQGKDEGKRVSKTNKSQSPWSYIKDFFHPIGTILSEDTTNIWRVLLKSQTSLQSLNITIHADWAWPVLTQTITRCWEFLQVINIGLHWPNVSIPMDMDVISQCIFLKKLTFNVMTSPSVEELELEYQRTRHGHEGKGLSQVNRCKVVNLSSLIACSSLETIYLTAALLDTEDLIVFTKLPCLTSLVIMYGGWMLDKGVNVGFLQDFLHLRQLNLLIIVEFYRQKHSMNTHLLKKILKSGINMKKNCPVIGHLVPHTPPGKYLYIGDIKELVSKDSLSDTSF